MSGDSSIVYAVSSLSLFTILCALVYIIFTVSAASAAVAGLLPTPRLLSPSCCWPVAWPPSGHPAGRSTEPADTDTAVGAGTEAVAAVLLLHTVAGNVAVAGAVGVVAGIEFAVAVLLVSVELVGALGLASCPSSALRA